MESENNVINYKNKGGRPEKSESEKRKLKLVLRINEVELQKMSERYRSFLTENNLQKFHYTKSEYFRALLLKENLEKKVRDYNISKLVYEVNKIGNNINQAVKKINSEHTSGYRYESELGFLKKKMEELYELTEKF